MKVSIIGAGYSGLAAAYDLAKAGFEVSVWEADDDIGGLAGTFEISPGIRLEKFYHHWFTSDYPVIDFLKELGLENGIRYRDSHTGIYYANSCFRLKTPIDLLNFKPLPIIDRIRTGIMALAARKIKRWEELENISAEDWIRSWAGNKSYEVIWRPLLKGKFGIDAENVSAVWFWNKIKLRGSSRDKKGEEKLAYFEGSFGAATTGIKNALLDLGVEIHTNSPVSEIVSEDQKICGLRIRNELIETNAVLCTTPLPIFLQLAPKLPIDYLNHYSKVRHIGNTCLILRLKHSLSDTYWLNVADPSFPFVAVIEHTNFESTKNFGGEHIIYLSKYLPTDSKLFQMSDREFYNYALPYLQRIFPEFGEDWVIGFNVWKAHYSQPIITKNYSSYITEFETPIKNLWVTNMAQIYPQDRGTAYAVEYGRKVASKVIEKYKETKISEDKLQVSDAA